MAHEFTCVRRVEFADTDMAGIVHFSNYFRYMEATEHAFFRSLGLALHTEEGGEMRGWARVHAECDYRLPLRYEEEVEVRLVVTEKGVCTLGYDFAFRVGGEPKPRARGRMRVCHVGRAAGEDALRAVPIPEDVDRRLEIASAARA